LTDIDTSLAKLYASNQFVGLFPVHSDVMKRPSANGRAYLFAVQNDANGP
jgi:hypothetical protein